MGEERIDVFKPDGTFVTEIKNTPSQGCNIAVDSTGRIYVPGTLSIGGKFECSATPRLLPAERSATGAGTCVSSGVPGSQWRRDDPTDDHLYVALGGNGVKEYNASCVFAETVVSGVSAGDVDVLAPGRRLRHLRQHARRITRQPHSLDLQRQRAARTGEDDPCGRGVRRSGRKTACSSSPSTR